ncbi:DUF1722 domain-containing protein [Klebsiella pneumoniae subsp. pneumoniae]|nr:DUF1722 domain-containing protein [Klebsiella pneumoniae subsp. pneumoniae]
MGPFVASLHEWEDLEAFFEVYREKLMAILKQPASRKNHTNVLMHIQGYFRDQLNSRQRGELREVILNYRAGLLPILAPLTLLKHYLAGVSGSLPAGAELTSIPTRRIWPCA